MVVSYTKITQVVNGHSKQLGSLFDQVATDPRVVMRWLVFDGVHLGFMAKIVCLGR